MTNPDWPTIKGGGILLSIIGQNRAGRQHPFYLLASGDYRRPTNWIVYVSRPKISELFQFIY